MAPDSWACVSHDVASSQPERAHVVILEKCFPPDVLNEILRKKAFLPATHGGCPCVGCAHRGLLEVVFPAPQLAAVLHAHQPRAAFAPTEPTTQASVAHGGSSEGICADPNLPCPRDAGSADASSSAPAATAAPRLDQRLDLSYADAAWEDRFSQWYSRSLMDLDAVSSLVYIVLACSAYFLIAYDVAHNSSYGWAKAASSVAPLVVGAAALGLVLPTARTIAPGWLARHRESVVAGVRAAILVHIILHRHVAPGFHAAASPLVAVLNSSGVLPLFAPAVRHRIRFSSHLRLHTVLFLLCLSSNYVIRRQQLLAGVSSRCSLPLGLLAGYSAPTIVVYCMERRARAGFLQHVTRSSNGVKSKAS